MKIELRRVLISDAKKLHGILNHPEFCFFPSKPVTIKEEREFIRSLKDKAKKGIEHPFVIIANGELIGGAGIHTIDKDSGSCEIGYFVDRKYWGKGIATKAVTLLEEFIADKLDITRVVIAPAKGNLGSRAVAVKCGYKKKSPMLKKYLNIGGKLHDCHLYVKILK
jgi:ribosomal-protein-alanine N-acetyltransferase